GRKELGRAELRGPEQPVGQDAVRAAGPLPLHGRQQPGELGRPVVGRGARPADARAGAAGVLPVLLPVAAPERAGQPRGADQVSGDAMLSGEITIRVRYAETDRMGLLHHANYLVYFEQGRTELLRGLGKSYRELEDQGFL